MMRWIPFLVLATTVAAVPLLAADSLVGEPKTCSACSGADKDKPVVGLVILKDLSLKKDGSYGGGTILDPNDGKVYKATVWVEHGKLKVRGYLGIFHRTQTWLKAS
jgi:uncharacterized protein (DUF2147 family)